MASVSRFQAVALACLSVVCWPLSLFLLFLNYAVLATSQRKPLRALVRQMPGFRARNVLITGSSPYALRLARAFHETGHHVTLAAAQTGILPSHTTLSFARRNFIRLRTGSAAKDSSGWLQQLLDIVSKEHVELWIDCNTDISASALMQAKAIIERKTGCICFSASPMHAPIFSKPSTFLKYAAENGLPVPESYEVKSRDDIHKILHQSRGKRKYILSETNGSDTARSSMLLPRRTLSQTYDEVARIKILQNSRLRLDQSVEDDGHYSSTSIIVGGRLKAFAAGMVSGESHACAAIQPGSALNVAMMQFVVALVSKMDDYTGHLSIDFTVDERPGASTIERRILPISARTSPDAPILLFGGLEGSINLVRAYVSIFGRSANGFIRGDDDVSSPTVQLGHERGVYAFGSEFNRLLITPLLHLVTFRTSLFYALGAAIAFVKQLCFWQEGVYDFKDPLPFWYLYQVYIPIRLLIAALRGTTSELAADLRGILL